MTDSQILAAFASRASGGEWEVYLEKRCGGEPEWTAYIEDPIYLFSGDPAADRDAAYGSLLDALSGMNADYQKSIFGFAFSSREELELKLAAGGAG